MSTPKYIQLNELQVNEKAIVHDMLDQNQRMEFMERGLLIGEELTMLRKSTLGHMLALEVRGTVLAMRHCDACLVIVLKNQ